MVKQMSWQLNGLSRHREWKPMILHFRPTESDVSSAFCVWKFVLKQAGLLSCDSVVTL